MDAVILAAGKGLRLRPFTETKPKGLVDIAGKPLLQYTLECLPKNTNNIHFVVGYLGDQIKSHFGNNFNNIPITYYTQDPLNGTGSALSLVNQNVSQDFLVLNGDDLYSAQDIEKLSKTEYGLLVNKEEKELFPSVINNNGFAGGFERNKPGNPAYRVCGAYKLTKDYFNVPAIPIPVRGNTEYSLPHTLLSLADKIKIALVEATFWQPVGTPEELTKAIEIKNE